MINRLFSSSTKATDLKMLVNSVCNKKPIHPNYITQSDKTSNVKNGKYDLANLSQQDINIIIQVLRSAFSGKYAKKFQALGLMNEAYGIVYAPRYILLKIIVELYKDSTSAYDCLAVAVAYEKMGAAYRQDALRFYEKYLSKATFTQRANVRNTFVWLFDRFLYNNISVLYEAEYDLDNALKFALMAEKDNTDALPYYPIHVSKILCKIKPQDAVNYLLKCMANPFYLSCVEQLRSQLQDAEEKLNSEYKYTPRKRKIKPSAIHEDINNTSKMFLPGGYYYKFWNYSRRCSSMKNYLNKNMLPNEKLLKSAEFSKVAFMPSVCIFILFLLGSFAYSGEDKAILIFGGFILALLFAIPGIKTVMFNVLAVTDKKIIGKTGFIKTSELISPIQQVQNVNVKSGIIGKILKYATVSITTTTGLYCYKYVKNASDFKSAVLNATEINDSNKMDLNAQKIANAIKSAEK